MFPLLCSLMVAGASDVRVDQPYAGIRSQPVAYDVDFRVVVTAPQNTKRLRVWVPIPPSDAIQTVESLGWSVFPNDIKPMIATESLFGNTFAYFEFAQPQGAYIIEHRFRVSTAEVRWNIDIESRRRHGLGRRQFNLRSFEHFARGG